MYDVSLLMTIACKILVSYLDPLFNQNLKDPNPPHLFISVIELWDSLADHRVDKLM